MLVVPALADKPASGHARLHRLRGASSLGVTAIVAVPARLVAVDPRHPVAAPAIIPLVKMIAETVSATTIVTAAATVTVLEALTLGWLIIHSLRFAALTMRLAGTVIATLRMIVMIATGERTAPMVTIGRVRVFLVRSRGLSETNLYYSSRQPPSGSR